jgi:transglutaminase-like putative cysteine protease
MSGTTANCEEFEPPPLKPESDRLDDYLQCDEIIDWSAPAIVAAARGATCKFESDFDKAKCLYQWVRDNIPHSCDAGHEMVTCRASDVLQLQTGTCFAKSHLLAAMLRAVGVPTGFCYQRLRYDRASSAMILHGLSGVFLASLGRWIRLDPRGNKAGVDAQFRLDREQLAFPTNAALGELLYPTVFVEPLPSVVDCLTTSATVSEALARLPESID